MAKKEIPVRENTGNLEILPKQKNMGNIKTKFQWGPCISSKDIKLGLGSAGSCSLHSQALNLYIITRYMIYDQSKTYFMQMEQNDVTIVHKNFSRTGNMCTIRRYGNVFEVFCGYIL